MKKKQSQSLEKAIQIIRHRDGIIRTTNALQLGIHPRTLYQLRDSGDLAQISRGVFCLTDMEPVSNPDLIIVASRIPSAVICLVSALSFHMITTQIPHVISVAIPDNSKPSAIDYPPVQFHKYSDETFQLGIEEHLMDGILVKVYDPEKTLADCFKFRNKIGMDIVLEALKLYKSRMKFNYEKILGYARICKVEKIARPYLEALI